MTVGAHNLPKPAGAEGVTVSHGIRVAVGPALLPDRLRAEAGDSGAEERGGVPADACVCVSACRVGGVGGMSLADMLERVASELLVRSVGGGAVRSQGRVGAGMLAGKGHGHGGWGTVECMAEAIVFAREVLRRRVVVVMDGLGFHEAVFLATRLAVLCQQSHAPGGVTQAKPATAGMLRRKATFVIGCALPGPDAGLLHPGLGQDVVTAGKGGVLWGGKGAGSRKKLGIGAKTSAQVARNSADVLAGCFLYSAEAGVGGAAEAGADLGPTRDGSGMSTDIPATPADSVHRGAFCRRSSPSLRLPAATQTSGGNVDARRDEVRPRRPATAGGAPHHQHARGLPTEARLRVAAVTVEGAAAARPASAHVGQAGMRALAGRPSSARSSGTGQLGVLAREGSALVSSRSEASAYACGSDEGGGGTRHSPVRSYAAPADANIYGHALREPLSPNAPPRDRLRYLQAGCPRNIKDGLDGLALPRALGRAGGGAGAGALSVTEEAPSVRLPDEPQAEFAQRLVYEAAVSLAHATRGGAAAAAAAVAAGSAAGAGMAAPQSPPVRMRTTEAGGVSGEEQVEVEGFVPCSARPHPALVNVAALPPLQPGESVQVSQPAPAARGVLCTQSQRVRADGGWNRVDTRMSVAGAARCPCRARRR